MDNNIKIAFSLDRLKLYNYAKEQEALAKAELERQWQEEERLVKEKTLESSVLAEFYRYKRIEDPYGSRLLILNSGDKTEKLTGRLEDFWVGHTGGYKALSYVWGEPKLTDMIFIEGKRLAITDSLGIALRRLRPPASQPPLRIWIDQICINQKDTIERNQQVRLMHAIFKNSTQVLVWLGADTDGHAPRAFQMAQSLSSIFQDKLLSKLCKAKGANFDWIPIEYWKSLRELTRLPWFRRAWIPQEIGTETDATVHWGDESISWIALHGSMKHLETQGWELKKKHKIDTSAITVLFRRFATPATDKASDQAHQSFIYQLCLSARNIASDPRDYIYSQLGHPSAWISSENAMIIQPDYDNTVSAVYHEIAIRALTTSATLTVLNAVSDTGDPKPPLGPSPLPTWVPRWDAGRFGSIIGYPGRYAASGNLKSNITKISFDDSFSTLTVKGLIVDNLASLTSKFPSNAFNPDSSKRDLLHSAWRLCRTYRPDPSLSTLKAFLDALAPVARFTSLSSHTGLSTPSLAPDDTAVYCCGVAALSKLFPATYFNTKHDPRRVLTPATEKSNATAWIQAAEDHAVQRCFGVTREKGYFALVPPTAKVGDVVVLLVGGETPFVLRQNRQSETWSFVGEAYVTGLMEDKGGMLGVGAEVRRFRLR
ncbi:heterokaryon incompatibility protein-domain-containing protein [Corynascus similis CBS 632.67]